MSRKRVDKWRKLWIGKIAGRQINVSLYLVAMHNIKKEINTPACLLCFVFIVRFTIDDGMLFLCSTCHILQESLWSGKDLKWNLLLNYIWVHYPGNSLSYLIRHSCFPLRSAVSLKFFPLKRTSTYTLQWPLTPRLLAISWSLIGMMQVNTPS